MPKSFSCLFLMSTYFFLILFDSFFWVNAIVWEVNMWIFTNKQWTEFTKSCIFFSPSVSKRVYLMSMFFFRFRNLRRAEETRKNPCGNTYASRNMKPDTLTTPSRLLERPLDEPLDSMDEYELQIPRFIIINCNNFRSFNLILPRTSVPVCVLILSLSRFLDYLEWVEN